MPDAPPRPPPPPSFAAQSARYAELSADLLTKLHAVQQALVAATTVRQATLTTLSSNLEDARGPPPIPALVRSFAPHPSGADMASLTAQLRRRAAFDAFQMATHLAARLAGPLGRARARVRACHRPERYRCVAAADDDDGLREAHFARLRADMRAVRRARAVVGEAVEGALGEKPFQGEWRWVEYVVGVGGRRTEGEHCRLIESVYENIAGFEELGHSFGDDMRYLVTACREFQGLLAGEWLMKLVDAVKKLEEAWEREFIWEKRGEEASEAERMPEPVEGVTWGPLIPLITEEDGVRSDVATHGDEDDVALLKNEGVSLQEIHKCGHHGSTTEP
ncbi:hypothetical protein NpNSSI1_00002593 [Neofusicoccum parvum]|nr:hypothetical protein NpNSSI1_00002593 [Neofusicoccum parvum]